MSVFHAPCVPAIADARATQTLERLCGQVDALRTRPLAGEDFERVERELHERFVEAEREVLGELLERLDVDVASVEIGERRYHRVLNSTETYTTAVGAVKVRRTLYRCGRERAVVPMELRVGMVEGHWTPLAARQASYVVAQMTPKAGEALFRELGNMAPSKSSLDRLPKGLSARWEASREQFESTLRDTSVVPDEAVTVAVSLDGVMVPMKDGCRANKRERSRTAGRRVKGPAGYQEAGCATLSFHDAEGERLKAALDACYGENDATGRAQFHKLRHLLLDDPGGVEKVIRALDYQRKRFPRRTRIGEVLRYFRRNRHRMRYAHTQARHRPIGSGVVETRDS